MSAPAKPKTTKNTKPRPPPAHPKYSEMIHDAIAALKERSGSSRQKIGKYIQANFKVGDGFENHLKMALRRGVANGTLIHTKGIGAAGSFKNAKKDEKPKKRVAKPKTAKPKPKVAAKPKAKTDKPKTTKAKSTDKKTSKPKTKSPAKPKKPAAAKAKTTKTTTKKPAAAKKPAAKKPATKKSTKSA